MPADLDCPQAVQSSASSLSSLAHEQKLSGKEREVRRSDGDEERARSAEKDEGRDGPAMSAMAALFLTHRAAHLVHDQLDDPRIAHWTTSQLAAYDDSSSDRDDVMAALSAEQSADVAALDALHFPSAPLFSLPDAVALPSLPTPEQSALALSHQPSTDVALLSPVRPAIPSRFFVPVAPADPATVSPRHTATAAPGEAKVEDPNASLFSSALELSALSANVPDLPDLPDYSDIAPPEMPDIPDVPEPSADDDSSLPADVAAAAGARKDAAASAGSSTAPVASRSPSVSLNSSSAIAPPYLNAMPASMVYNAPVTAAAVPAGTAMGGSGAGGAHAPLPPRPARPTRATRGLPTTQGVSIGGGAGGSRGSGSLNGPTSNSASAANQAALNAALRTTLHDISDEQLQDVLANK